ncbi:MAG: signal peptide peptidase SppA [Candidatus Coatesbacteria bacterium]|nr:signal peptide peptidase SppA [Candidatus Coatesbacteria bacterium]
MLSAFLSPDERIYMRFLILFILFSAGLAGASNDGFDDLFTAQSDYPFSQFLNPAALAAHDGFDIYSSMSYVEENSNIPKFTDVSAKFGNFFGMTYRHRADNGNISSMNNLGLTAAIRFHKAFMIGTTYDRYYFKDDETINYGTLNAGFIMRPHRFASLGFVANELWSDNDYPKSYSAGIGIRPGTEMISLYADLRWEKGEKISKGDVYYGAFIEPLDGITIGASYKDKNKYGFNIGFNMRYFGIGTRTRSVGDMKTINPYIFYSSSIRPTLVNETKYISGMKIQGKIDNSGASSFLFGSNPSIRDYIDAIHTARRDATVKAIYVKVGNLDTSWALIEELRTAISEFRSTGRKVLVYMESGGMKEYYLATASDKIVMCPEGSLMLEGISMRGLFLKGLMDRLKITVQYTKHGKYKSAVEMLANEKWSDPARKQMEEFLDDIDNEITTEMAKKAKLTKEQFTEKVYKKVILHSEEAKMLGLIDAVMYEKEAKRFANTLIARKGDKIDDLSYFTYYDKRWDEKPAIVVLNAEGSIARGENGNSLLSGKTMGSDGMIKLIRAASRIPNTKGIVFRVDSGGGDGLASDLIWHELKELRNKKKSLVVSMGNMAASGGYYISIPAERIFADKTTLTGSIGVFWMNFSVKDLANWLGVKTEIVRRAPHAGNASIYEKLSAEELKLLQDFVDNDYQRFVNKVAMDRKLSPSYIDSVGQGRIWSGPAGKKLGLVDEIGGLDQAIRYIANQNNLKEGEYRIIYIPKHKSFLKQIMDLPMQLRKSVEIPFNLENQILYLCPFSLD